MIGYDGVTVTISAMSGVVESLIDDLEEVAPVVCFLWCIQPSTWAPLPPMIYTVIT